MPVRANAPARVALSTIVPRGYGILDTNLGSINKNEKRGAAAQRCPHKSWSVLPSSFRILAHKIMSLAKRWVWTLNNPTDEERFLLSVWGESIDADGDQSDCSYLVFGDETGEQGTRHLQGYVELRRKKRISFFKSTDFLCRAHLEVSRGTSRQASDYCKKDGDFQEYGECALGAGNASKFEQLRNWVAAQEESPTFRDVWDEFPDLAGRYKSAVLECIALFGARPKLVDGELRLWQHAANERVNGEADDRSIYFYVDTEGNRGKSWLTRYWMSHLDGAQFLSVGKRDDLAYSVDVNSRVFVFDIPRGSMQYVQYGLFEQLKNRLVYSPKYTSVTKIIKCTPHVVVFCNEHPDMNALTADRYKIIEL